MTVIETVTSPSGERVDIVDTDPVGYWSQVRPIVEALWYDGPFEDVSGGATQMIFAAAKRRGYDAFNPRSIVGVLGHGSLSALVERTINGKRTYAIRLRRLPKDWHNSLTPEPTPVLTAKERSSRRVPCPRCGRDIGLNNLHRHLTQRHHESHHAATDLVRATRKGTPLVGNLPAVVETNGHVEAEVDETEPFDARATSIDLMLAMIHGVRPPLGKALSAWLQQTERTLTELTSTGE